LNKSYIIYIYKPAKIVIVQGFGVFTAVEIQIEVVWVVTPYSAAGSRIPTFGGLHNQEELYLSNNCNYRILDFLTESIVTWKCSIQLPNVWILLGCSGFFKGLQTNATLIENTRWLISAA